MVAYSFQQRFAAPILAGTKRQTIRADRRRHARPGEQLQLYTGMRTKHCRLIGRATCMSIEPVRLVFARPAFCFAEMPELGDRKIIGPRGWEPFAKEDGFESVEDMARFWFEQHGDASDHINFEGVLIRWEALGG